MPAGLLLEHRPRCRHTFTNALTEPSACRATITRLRGIVSVMKSFGSGSSLAWATIDGTRPNTSSRSRCASSGSVYCPGPNGTSWSTVSVLPLAEVLQGPLDAVAAGGDGGRRHPGLLMPAAISIVFRFTRSMAA